MTEEKKENEEIQEESAKEQEKSPDELLKLEEEVEAKKKEVEEAEKKSEVELFRKLGYKILSDIKYQGKILTVGSRNKLVKLSKKETHHLIANGIISR